MAQTKSQNPAEKFNEWDLPVQILFENRSCC